MHVTCVDWSELGMTEPVRTEAGIVLVPLDRAGIDRVWAPRRLPVPRRLPRHEPAHAAPPPGVGRTTARRTTRSAATRGRARTRASSSRSDPGVVAFDTELFGHHWHEGVTFLEAMLSSARSSRSRSREHGAGARRPAHELGRRARPAHLERRARLDAARRRAARAQRARRTRARCASCSRCRPPTGRSRSSTRSAGDYPRERAPTRTTRRSTRRAFGGRPIQNCAIWRQQLADWAFVQP